MKIAVVTPYFREGDEVLKRCLDSVAAQTLACTHVLAADGHPNPLVDAYPGACHLKLPEAHGDNGDTPRGLGAAWAIDKGYEAVAFLDADNWFQPNHIESLVGLFNESGAEVLVAGRSFHRADGSRMAGLREAGDGVHFADTSCLMLTGQALRIAPLWATIPKPLAPIADRIFWQMLMAHGFKLAQSPLRSVAFFTQYAQHYAAMGEAPPKGAKDASQSQAAVAWWNGLTEDERAGFNRQMGFP